MSVSAQLKVESAEQSPFSCPHCKAAYSGGPQCGSCGKDIAHFESIPLLIRDYQAVQGQIDDARAKGRGEWYQDDHENIVWKGPWRHHFLKRKNYVTGILDGYKARKGIVPRLLDMGCGDGAHMVYLKDYAREVYGSDYNIIRLLRAEKKGIARQVVLADATDYAAQDNSFDIIFFNHVLEHIPEDEKALSEIRRILKPGGICVLGVPNEGAFFSKLAYWLEPYQKRDTDHVQFYTGESLRQKCVKAGLKVQEVKHIGWGVPHFKFDEMLRKHKFFDDFFEFIGSRLYHKQATSLYIILEK